jgi:hypothetical protein
MAWGGGDYSILLPGSYRILVRGGENAALIVRRGAGYSTLLSNVSLYGTSGDVICGKLSDGRYFIQQQDSYAPLILPAKEDYLDTLQKQDVVPPVLKEPKWEDSVDAIQNEPNSFSSVLWDLTSAVFVVLILLVIAGTVRVMWVRRKRRQNCDVSHGVRGTLY